MGWVTRFYEAIQITYILNGIRLGGTTIHIANENKIITSHDNTVTHLRQISFKRVTLQCRYCSRTKEWIHTPFQYKSGVLPVEKFWTHKSHHTSHPHWLALGPNTMMLSYQYRKSHCLDTMILRPTHLHNGISILVRQHFYMIILFKIHLCQIRAPRGVSWVFHRQLGIS